MSYLKMQYEVWYHQSKVREIPYPDITIDGKYMANTYTSGIFYQPIYRIALISPVETVSHKQRYLIAE